MATDFGVSLPYLQVGTWVQFSTREDLTGESPEALAVYQADQYFLAIADEHRRDDPHRGTLMDVFETQAYDYCPRTLSLSPSSFTEVRLSNTSVNVVSRKSVEEIHGAEKVSAVYRSAKQHIGKNPQYFEFHANETLKV